MFHKFAHTGIETLTFTCPVRMKQKILGSVARPPFKQIELMKTDYIKARTNTFYIIVFKRNMKHIYEAYLFAWATLHNCTLKPLY